MYTILIKYKFTSNQLKHCEITQRASVFGKKNQQQQKCHSQRKMYIRNLKLCRTKKKKFIERKNKLSHTNLQEYDKENHEK